MAKLRIALQHMTDTCFPLWALLYLRTLSDDNILDYKPIKTHMLDSAAAGTSSPLYLLPFRTASLFLSCARQ